MDWQWYTDDNMLRVWVHFLFKANREAKKWKEKTVKRGQFISGRKILARELGISEQKLRTCIDRLKSTSELTTEPTNRFTLFTIVNYSKYQEAATSKITNQPPTNNQQITTTKEVKNIRSSSLLINNDEKSSYQKCVDIWLKEIHEGWTFGAVHGKHLKQIISKIEKISRGEDVADLFRAMCLRLPEWYKNKDLAVINSKFIEIITEIKNGKESGIQKLADQIRQSNAGI